jgi:hypothetical protein
MAQMLQSHCLRLSHHSQLCVSPENAIFAEQPHDKVAKDLKIIFTKT